MTELVAQMRQQQDFEVPAERLRAASDAMGSAQLGVERAFRIGALTIVDAPCWEAMGVAYIKFQELRLELRTRAATELRTLQEMEQYIDAIADHTSEFGKSVDALSPVADDRLSPADTTRNRRRRDKARPRLEELLSTNPQLMQMHQSSTSAGG
jgi:hypothetical protein